MNWSRGLASGLLSAALAATASRPWGLGVVALVAYVPAFGAVLRSPRPLQGAAVAALAAVGVASVGYEAVVGIFPGAYLVALITAPLPFALAGALAVRFRDSMALRRLEPSWRTAIAALAIAAMWCAAEVLPARPELFGVWAFPLGAIGYSQIELPSADLARLSSVTAVSLFVLLANAALVVLWPATLAHSVSSRAERRPVLAAVGVLCLLAASVAATAAAAGPLDSAAPTGARRSLSVHLVQPNLPDSVYAAASEVSAVEDRLIARLLGAVTVDSAPNAGRHDLTMLPEAAWPGVIRPSAAQLLAGAFEPAGPVLFGAVSAGWQPVDQADGRYANSVMLLRDGELRHVYDKRRLVPVAEAGLRSGAGPRLVEVAGFSIAPLVCYDVVFSADVRAAARAGADLLAVFTDDSFAANSDVSALHLRVAVMRALETGLPVALVANTGPSAVVSESGEILAITRTLEASTLTATVVAGDGNTPYVRYGDWVGASALALSLGIGVISVAGGGAPELYQGPT